MSQNKEDDYINALRRRCFRDLLNKKAFETEDNKLPSFITWALTANIILSSILLSDKDYYAVLGVSILICNVLFLLFSWFIIYMEHKPTAHEVDEECKNRVRIEQELNESFGKLKNVLMQYSIIDQKP